MPSKFVREHGIWLTYNPKPILAVDFDGVLHSYTSGWKHAKVIPDDPVQGAQGFCYEAMEHFTVFVYSTRCSEPGGPQAILAWLEKWRFPDGMFVSKDGIKPPATMTIDDRAWCFANQWPPIEAILSFKPWNKAAAKSREG